MGSFQVAEHQQESNIRRFDKKYYKSAIHELHRRYPGYCTNPATESFDYVPFQMFQNSEDTVNICNNRFRLWLVQPGHCHYWHILVSLLGLLDECHHL